MVSDGATEAESNYTQLGRGPLVWEWVSAYASVCDCNFVCNACLYSNPVLVYDLT